MSKQNNQEEPKKTGFDFLRAAGNQATVKGAFTMDEARSVSEVIEFLEKSQQALLDEIEKLRKENDALKSEPSPG